METPCFFILAYYDVWYSEIYYKAQFHGVGLVGLARVEQDYDEICIA